MIPDQQLASFAFNFKLGHYIEVIGDMRGAASELTVRALTEGPAAVVRSRSRSPSRSTLPPSPSGGGGGGKRDKSARLVAPFGGGSGGGAKSARVVEPGGGKHQRDDGGGRGGGSGSGGGGGGGDEDRCVRSRVRSRTRTRSPDEFGRVRPRMRSPSRSSSPSLPPARRRHRSETRSRSRSCSLLGDRERDLPKPGATAHQLAIDRQRRRQGLTFSSEYNPRLTHQKTPNCPFVAFGEMNGESKPHSLHILLMVVRGTYLARSIMPTTFSQNTKGN